MRLAMGEQHLALADGRRCTLQHEVLQDRRVAVERIDDGRQPTLVFRMLPAGVVQRTILVQHQRRERRCHQMSVIASERDCGVSNSAPSSVMTMMSSRRTPNLPY